MRPLTVADLNPAVLKVQYAVRGELAIKAEELRDKLQTEKHDLPFKKVISSNIGNPQQKGLDQPFLTFTRQVRILAVCRRDALLRRSAGRRAHGVPSSRRARAGEVAAGCHRPREGAPDGDRVDWCLLAQ